MRRILITGSSGYIGEQLVRSLAARDDVERIVGVDRTPAAFALAKFVPLAQDVAVPLDAALQQNAIDTIVHAAYPVRPAHGELAAHRALLQATKQLYESAAHHGVAQVVYLSSATVYGFAAAGAQHHPFTEDAPLCENARLAYVRYKVLAEHALDAAQSSGAMPTLTVLRPSFVVGRGSRNPLFEYLARRWVLLARQLAPLQLTHVDDVAAAVGELIARRMGGVFNLGSAGGVDAGQIACRMGAKTIAIAPALLHPLNTLAWQLRLLALTPAPTAALELLERPWQVDSGRIASRLGFHFRHTGEQALECMARERMEARYRARFNSSPD